MNLDQIIDQANREEWQHLVRTARASISLDVETWIVESIVRTTLRELAKLDWDGFEDDSFDTSKFLTTLVEAGTP